MSPGRLVGERRRALFESATRALGRSAMLQRLHTEQVDLGRGEGHGQGQGQGQEMELRYGGGAGRGSQIGDMGAGGVSLHLIHPDELWNLFCIDPRIFSLSLIHI